MPRGLPTETMSSDRFCCLCVENRCPICHLQKKTKTVFAIEHLYCIVSSNIIMPFPFSLNILTYYKLNSKTICNMYSSDYHAGSYTYVLKRIEEHPANPITIPFQHDVITYFDNNQVLARNWRYML